MFLSLKKKDVRDVVKDTYSDVENSSQIYGLKLKLCSLNKGEKSVTSYFNELMNHK